MCSSIGLLEVKIRFSETIIMSIKDLTNIHAYSFWLFSIALPIVRAIF